MKRVDQVTVFGNAGDRRAARTVFALISGYTDDAIAHHGVLDSGTPVLATPFTATDRTTKVREVLDEGMTNV